MHKTSICIHKTSIFIYKYHLVKKKKPKKKLRAKSHDLDREPVKPLTRTRETPTRKTWGRGLTGTGTGWPGIPQGYPWYSLLSG